MGSMRNSFRAQQGNILDPVFPRAWSHRSTSSLLIRLTYRGRNTLSSLRRSYDTRTQGALFGGPSGLEFYRAIARIVSRQGFLKPDAVVALEVGHDQAEEVEDILRDTGEIQRTEIWNDPWGKARTVAGWRT